MCFFAIVGCVLVYPVSKFSNVIQRTCFNCTTSSSLQLAPYTVAHQSWRVHRCCHRCLTTPQAVLPIRWRKMLRSPDPMFAGSCKQRILQLKDIRGLSDPTIAGSYNCHMSGNCLTMADQDYQNMYMRSQVSDDCRIWQSPDGH